MPGTPQEQIHEIAIRDYSGREEDAFPYWALSCILADQQPERNDLRDHVAVGDGDLGIDGYWIDEFNRRLILLQAKYSARTRRDEATAFRSDIEALIDPEYVHAHANEVIREIYPELLEALIDDSYTIQAVLACGGQVAPTARSYARTTSSQNWQFQIGDDNHTKEIQLQILDLTELSSLRDDLLRDLIEPYLELPVTIVDNNPSFHYMGGDFPAVQATVPARILIDAYDQYRSAIFRYNPRGPLGSNKVNKEIQHTLEDTTLKRHFHLLNNGLTSMANGITYNQRSSVLEVTDFQIVNGCQTVFTLYRLRDHVTDDVKVTVRVVEGLHGPWANEISKASNYQTAVRPEQLASLGAEHDEIQHKFDRLVPPWFYEKQKGYVQFLNAAGKRSHRQRYGGRNLSASEVGQYGVAFLAQPVLAKYDLQRLFERKDNDGERLYRLIFVESNEASQLALPVIVGRRIEQAVKQRLAALKPVDDQEPERFSERNWLPYARMHMTALIGEQLRLANVPKGEILDASVCSERWASIDDWFDGLFAKARSAVALIIGVEKRADKLHNLREFFRNTDRYTEMVTETRDNP